MALNLRLLKFKENFNFKVIKLAVIMSFIMITAFSTYADELKSLENQTLQELATIIRQKDEALTRAVNYYVHLSAMSGYEKNLTFLEKALELATSKGDSKDKSIFKQVDIANQVLAKIEDKAVALAKEGKQKEAIQLMEGIEYQESKKKYSEALDSFYKKYGVDTGETESLTSLENKTLKELAVFIRQKDLELTQAVKDYIYVSPTANDDQVSPISDYEKNLEWLEKATELAVSKGDSADKAIFKQIEDENNILAAIEEKAIALAKAGSFI
ncbi:PAS/PAC sensor signal transduction histidine kinase [Candidatus Thiomargarita nelsonii]|uniref:PAS/PAC sensor signal transduction histidine kinase n=1 Tax=Candidatus Thiomargarita nelsonii TaxID=1003181 RepID=A0A0A6NZ19_9GAMM|nr:PAS/PAC sensor signal transduction histidine kinase [Candidatus Thiomargarita nelsonii]